MVKKILVIIIALSLLIVPNTVFADTSSEHTHDFSGNAISFGLDVDGISVQFTETSCIESSCTYVKYDADFLVFHFSYVSDTHLSPDEVSKKFWEWRLKQLGKDNSLDKMDSTNGGSNIPAPGGRNPKGYGDEGKPNVNSTGASCIWVEPFGISHSGDGFHKFAPAKCVTGSSQTGTNWPISDSWICPEYYFTAPVSGLYFVGSYGSPYDFGTISFFFDNKWHLKYYTANFSEPYNRSISLKKGESCWLGFKFVYSTNPVGFPYKFSLNKIPIYIEPLGDSSITTTNNITINNNTWNGNIYTDNSTNLTYIYPQYTTINEKNETVTNISNTPIIYNNETKQYYTYDQTTKNYYYITYNAQPTPSPSPSPAPSESPTPAPTPDPGTTPTTTPKPGGSISTPETGKPGGSSGSGQSWWDKLLDKIGNAVIDGLLGTVSAVLKLIFKLFSTILSWIIWAVSRVFDLLPFLPPGLGGLLVGGVVVCFVIGIIKFIRG